MRCYILEKMLSRSDHQVEEVVSRLQRARGQEAGEEQRQGKEALDGAPRHGFCYNLHSSSWSRDVTKPGRSGA